MISDILTAVISNYMLSCFVLGLVVAAVQVVRWKHPRPDATVSGLFLNAFVLYAIGISLVINFVMHSVFGNYAASTIGWAQSPFQLELALFSLGVGVLAIIVHGRSTQLRAKTAVVVASAIFGWGAAGGHIYQTIVNDNHAQNNGGLLLYGDIAINAIGMAFVIWHAMARRHDTVQVTDATVLTGASLPTSEAVDETRVEVSHAR